jgi:polysaccharide biosynthesis PFTS motif protein
MYYLRENPNAAMVSKEFIFDQVVYLAMNSDKIDKLITTQSHIAFQPLIFEYNNFPAKKIMVWYSSNSVPIKYKREKLKRFTINRGVYANMRIDEHWVWSKKHKNYLSKYCDAKILVKKSLMLYTAEKLKPPITTIDVLVFDVTPHKNPEITQNSIYSSEEIINFINEIIICVKLLNKAHKMNFKIQLKHKRVFSKQNSSDYLNFINQKVANFEITVIDPNQNLYDLISKSKIVIGFPFASPVLIGQELNKPSIFYCSSKLLSTAQEDRKPLLIQSQTSLYKYLEKIFAVYK